MDKLYLTIEGVEKCTLEIMQLTPPPPEGGRLGVGCFRKITVRPPMHRGSLPTGAQTGER